MPYGLAPASALTNDPTYSEENWMYGEMSGPRVPSAVPIAAGAIATPNTCEGRKPESNPVMTAYRPTTGMIDAATPFHGPPARLPPTKPAIICPNMGSHHSIRDRMSTYFEALQKL